MCKKIIKTFLITLIVAMFPISVMACDSPDCQGHDYQTINTLTAADFALYFDLCEETINIQLYQQFGMYLQLQSVIFVVKSYGEYEDMAAAVRFMFGDYDHYTPVEPHFTCLFGLTCNWGTWARRGSSTTVHSIGEVFHPSSGGFYFIHLGTCTGAATYRRYCQRCDRYQSEVRSFTPFCCWWLKTTVRC